MSAQNIRDLVSRNQWEGVFSALKKAESNDENWRNQVVLLESRYRQLKLQITQGVLTPDEVNLEINRLRASVLSLVDELPPQPLPSFSRQKMAVMGAVLIGIMAIVGVFIYPPESRKMGLTQEIVQKEHVLTGQIQSNGENVAGVEVQIMGTALTASTDSKGFFKLPVPTENQRPHYLISLQKKGYETLRETYEMNSNQSPIYNLIKD